MFFKGILGAVNSTNIAISNTSCYSMILINAVVQLENIIASASYKVVAVILIKGIGNHSNLSNITVKCDGCYALAVIGRHDTHSCHVNIRDVTATGGKIKIENVHNHLSVSNVKATVYQNRCNYTVFSVLNCSSYMSITNVAVNGGRVAIVINGSHFVFKNFTINIEATLILTQETFHCYLLFIDGSNNSHHVDIAGIRVRGDGTISVSEINSSLNIDDIYTNVGLNVGFNGNNISIGNSYVVGIIRLLKNGDNITLRNITVGYSKDKTIGLSRDDDYLWNASALSVRGCGSYVSVSNVTIFNGIMVLFRNKNNISLQDVTVYIKSSFSKTNAKKFLDPDFDIQPIGLMVEQNHKQIIIKNIKIWNGSMTVAGNDNDLSVSDVYLNSYHLFNGVIVVSNKDNIMLSDIIIDGLAEIIITLNGNYLSVKNRLQAFQFTMVENGNNISVINVTATSNTSLTFQSNGGNITLNNVTIKRVSKGCGLSFFYNKGFYTSSSITLINVTVSECGCGIYAYGQSLLNFTSHPSSFINNTSINNGAGMQIGGGIILSSSVDVYFINNTAHGVGGAIYVDVNILKIESLVEFCTFQNFTPIFVNNTAVVAGNDVYNGKIWKCKHRYLFESVPDGSKTSPFIEAINCSSSISLEGFPTPLSSHVTSTPIGVCLCTDNGTTDCYTRSIHEHLNKLRLADCKCLNIH
uniref:Right handed beta helix domain-containing protein n=1 Tax=Amphimedon queenslandica TaxID=400682 RepID=A0A1X7UGA9_AMPQE